MGSIPDSSHVGLPLPKSPSDMAYSSGPSSVISTRETSPASSTHHLITTASPSLSRPKEAISSMDAYNNLFHPVGDRTANVSSSNIQQIGGRLSSEHFCANEQVMTNTSPLPLMGDQSAQLSPSYFYHSAAYSPSGMSGTTSLAFADYKGFQKMCGNSFHREGTHKSSRAPHNPPTTSLAGDETTTNIFSPSLVKQQRAMVTPPGRASSGVSHQHSASLAASLAANKAMTADVSVSTSMNHQTKELPSKYRSANHGPCAISLPQSACLVSNEDGATSSFVSIAENRTAKVSPGSSHEVNRSPTGVTGVTGFASHADLVRLAGTGHTKTATKSGRPLVASPSRPHSSTPVSCGPSTSNWQPSTTNLSSLTSPSTAVCSCTSSSPSHDNSRTRFAKTTSHLTDNNSNNNNNNSNNLSSPVSPVQHGASNAFPRHYVSIANPSRGHTGATSAFLRSDGDQSSQQQTTTTASLHDGDRSFQPASAAFRRSNVDQSSRYSHSTSTTSSSAANIASMHPTSGLVITMNDMDRAMAYCYDRGDGTFARLVPVDMLPVELEDIPARVASDEGMIVLPILRKAGPNGQPANSQLCPQTMVTPPTSPAGTTGTSTDLIQSRIDRIINSTPATPVTSGPVVLARGAGVRPVVSKREKIYCDKWIHDGTCAFTQQGCKFKHEMPADKETQMSLGLFHGFPPWWRRYCAEHGMPLDDSPVHGHGNGNNIVSGPASLTGASRYGSAAPIGSAPSGGALNAVSWRRRIEAPPAEGAPSPPSAPSSSFGTGGGGGARVSRGRGGHGRTGDKARSSQQPANFGPIGPPSKSDVGFDIKRKAAAAVASSATSSQDGTVLRGRFAPRRGGGAPLNLDQCEDLGGSDAKAGRDDKPDDIGHNLD